MPDPGFESLTKQLLERGVSPAVAARIAAELSDHYDDLERELLAASRSPDEAAAEARARLGDEAVIAQELVRRPELRSLIYRSALIVYCLGALVSAIVIVVAPFHALAEYRATLARYGAAVGAASVVTLTLLLAMELALRYSRDAANVLRPPVSLTGIGAARLVDSEYLPIVKVDPGYPGLAASRRLEGYVVVEFTVTPAGTVKDVVVIESSNELLHEAAIEATSQFKYEPRVVSGRRVAVPRVRGKIMFVLEA